MIRNKILLRSIALFLILETVLNSIGSFVLLALTAGPSAPEFSSFEPVDTSDMVNLATGSLVHSISLLEVPGPSGGFPISASYHAGIMPEQEASWIGLGWTLNLGAINRTTNGFSDDNDNSRREVRDYWDGGETTTKTYNLGINFPRTGIGINYSLARTRDTFKGFSINHYAAINAGGMSMDTKGNASISFDPVKLAIGLTGNSHVAAAYKNMGIIGGSNSVGLNISSKGVKAVVTVAGNTITQTNNSAGSISSYTTTTNIGAIPILNFGSIALKDYYTRYWSNQSDALYAYGSLYSARSNDKADYFTSASDEEALNYSEFRSYANDVYDLYDVPDPQDGSWDLNDDADPSKQTGGSFPSYDRYDVLGQGIGGIIEPFIFENGDIRGQNSYLRNSSIGTPFTDHPTLMYNSMRKFTTNRKVDFRFKNDFSNKLSITPEVIPQGSNSVGAHTVTAVMEGYDDSALNQKLEGSRHIDWFTNKQISTGEAFQKGFIDCYEDRLHRTLSKDIYDNYLQPEACVPSDKKNHRGKGSGIIKTDKYADANFDDGIDQKYQSLKPRTISLEEKIGGFMITNESGVTYHYAIPVYAYNEYTRLKMKKPVEGAATITEIKNDEPYAYTWLLTAITGPDFVDRGGVNGEANGILDDKDFGYWVKFDYGRWANSYQWRTPHSGYSTEIESEYATFSYGIKELYYLDAVETKSHKAFFIKSIRKDGKGVTSRLEGGSNPRKYQMAYDWSVDGTNYSGSIEFSVSPVSTMKLNSIHLFDKKDLIGLNINKSTGNKYEDFSSGNPKAYSYTGDNYIYQAPEAPAPTTIQNGLDFIEVNYHNGDLVLDDGDVAGLTDFTKKSLKIIKFDTDYSLAKNSSNHLEGVPNSFDFFSEISDQWNLDCMQNFCEGQSQLASFDFEWPANSGGPCYKMRPSCCDENDAKAFYSEDPISVFQQGPCDVNKFEGDLIPYFRTGKLTLNEIKVLGHGGADLIPSTRFTYEKNAPYAAKKYDDWGFYKSDYSEIYEEDWSPIVSSRRITSNSAKNVDVWSLSNVQSALGGNIKIKYEPNQYSQSVYNDYDVFAIEKLERISTNQLKISFKEKGILLSNFFQNNQAIDVKAFVVGLYSLWGSSFPYPDYYINTNTVAFVGDDYININSTELSELLRDGRQVSIDGGATVTLTPYFIAGVVSMTDTAPVKFAGGVRVKSILVEDFAGHQLSTEYGYLTPNATSSSGVTSFKPYNAIGVHYPDDPLIFNELLSGTSTDQQRIDLKRFETKFQKHLNRLYEKLLVNGRETPAPGVIYEYVTVKNKYDGVEFDQYKRYQFEVFKEEMISSSKTEYGSSTDSKSNVEVVNGSVGVGNLKRAITLSRDNKPLTETRYGYLYDDENKSFEDPLKVVGQGIVEQSFHKYVTVKDYINHGYQSGGYDIETVSSMNKAVVSTRKDYSNVMTSVEEIDYKTGIKSTTEYRSFDLYSGQPIKTFSKGAYGNSYMTEVSPAYRVIANESPVYSGMGIKLKNSGNKHMLSQQSTAYSYKVDNSENPIGLVSATVQTWSNQIPVLEPGQFLSSASPQGDVWRKHATYTFIGDNSETVNDGLYSLVNNSFPVFNSWEKDDEPSIGWNKENEITLYDVYSRELEAKDLNDQKAAVRFSFDQSKVIASITNSEFGEFGFSNSEERPIEDKFGSEVYHGTNEYTNIAHTGIKAIVADAGEKGFQFFMAPKQKTYRVSVWSNSATAKIKYSFDTNNPINTAVVKNVGQSGDWVLLEADIPVTESWDSIEIWCEAFGSTTFFDDFRVHPVDATMTSYVYNEWGELSHILDNNNVFTKFEYDDMGRLESTYKETFNHGIVRTSKQIYHYAGKGE